MYRYPKTPITISDTNIKIFFIIFSFFLLNLSVNPSNNNNFLFIMIIFHYFSQIYGVSINGLPKEAGTELLFFENLPEIIVNANIVAK